MWKSFTLSLDEVTCVEVLAFQLGPLKQECLVSSQPTGTDIAETVTHEWKGHATSWCHCWVLLGCKMSWPWSSKSSGIEPICLLFCLSILRPVLSTSPKWLFNKNEANFKNHLPWTQFRCSRVARCYQIEQQSWSYSLRQHHLGMQVSDLKSHRFQLGLRKSTNPDYVQW